MKRAHALVATVALAASFAAAVAIETVPRAAVAQQAARTKTGDRMPDGSVYAGVSPETGKAMYTTPKDAAGAYDWSSAGGYCADLQADGRHDWRVPSKGELNVLFQNRTAIGGFDESHLNGFASPSGRYWSSPQKYGKSWERRNDFAWTQRFSNGDQAYYDKRLGASVRCVR
jgi:hypothetical protein